MKQTYTITAFDKETKRKTTSTFLSRKDAISFSQWCEYRGIKTEFSYDVLCNYASAIDNATFLFNIDE